MTTEAGSDTLVRRAWPGRVAVAALLVESAAIVYAFRGFVTRPMAFDEQWRAYWVSYGPQLLHHLNEIPGPISGGWLAMQWVVSRVLPNTEWSLRMPQLVALAALGLATYALGRRWLPTLGAWAVAAAVLLNGPLLVYGVLMKPFVFEALCAIVILLLWLWLQDRERSTAAQVAVYVAMGVATVFGASAIFVAAPLLLLGLWRQRRGPRLALTVVGSGITGVIALIHLKFFYLVLGEQLLDRPYWQSFFVPRSSDAISFIAEQAKGFAHLPTASYLAPDTTDQYLAASMPPVTRFAFVIGVAFVVLVAWGTVVAARTRTGRGLLAATYGALGVQLAASILERWPFGMVRVNLFFVPLLYLLAGMGVTDLVRRAVAAVRPDPDRGDAEVRPVARAGLVALAVVSLLLAAAVVPVSVQTIRGFKSRYAAPVFVDRIRDAVRVVRSAAGPDDIVVAVLDDNGWGYYSFYYDDPSLDASGIARVPRERTLQVDDFLSPSINQFVDTHPDADRVLVFNFMGISPEYYDQQTAWMAQRNLCPTRRWDFDQTGIVTEFTRVAAGTPCGDPVRQPVPPLS